MLKLSMCVPTHINEHTYKGPNILVKAQSSAESAGPAIFHKLGLSLHPVWCFYHLANANISVIKTITEQHLQAMLKSVLRC